MKRFLLFAAVSLFSVSSLFSDDILKYPGKFGLPGSGKHVVLVSGDEEYRSEESVVQMGRILSQRHGFDCTVLFAVDPETGEINPACQTNIPGLDALATADVLILALRFRDLPDDQIQHLDAYLKSGRPVLGIRTSTHAFQIAKGKTFARYGFDYDDNGGPWQQGFGRLVLGETWIDHHGHHGVQATRAVAAPGREEHPILQGCEDIFGPTDVYRVRLPLTGDVTVLLHGRVLEGMTPEDKAVAGPKNEPPMPVAWLRSYELPGGKRGRAFTSTMGSSQDLESEGLRRLMVNAVYWLSGLEDRIPPRADVGIVGRYETLPMGFGQHKKGVKPSDFSELDRP